MGWRYRTVGETQHRFELRLEIIRVQLTGDLTGVGEIGPKWDKWSGLSIVSACYKAITLGRSRKRGEKLIQNMFWIE